MKKDIADIWVEALRSGNYKQTRHTLRRKNRDGNHAFCPLGLLCEISGLGGWVGDCYKVGQIETSICLPPQVVEWSGMTTDSGRFKTGNERMRLENTIIWRNDTDEYTFSMLADLIEKEWASL